MPILQLQELSENQDRYDTVARWDTERAEQPPEPFTHIYPEEIWREREPEFFLDRIDGPYTILTRLEREN